LRVVHTVQYLQLAHCTGEELGKLRQSMSSYSYSYARSCTTVQHRLYIHAHSCLVGIAH
jgi:hypothetical protein